MPLLTRFGFGFGFEIVDVRDAAGLHRLALENPDTISQRLIADNGFLWFRDITALLIDTYPNRRITNREMPSWLSRLASLFVHDIPAIVIGLEVVKELDNSTAISLGSRPRKPQQAILSGAKILIDLDVV